MAVLFAHMRASLVFLIAASACSFSGSGGSGNPDAGPDGQPDSNMDGNTDGMLPLPCLSGVYDLCADAPAPTGPLTVSGTQRVDTDVDSNCRKIIPQTGGPAICVQYYTTVNVPVGTTLIAHGSRAFALYASTSITIGGLVDVGSHRDSQTTEPGAGYVASCTFGGAPEEDAGGGAGGAGGTFATQGGAGGDGDADMSTAGDGFGLGGIAGATAPFSILRGGCPGQKGENNLPATGNGGRGGGAIYLASRAIQVLATGSVRATGAGGDGGGVEGSGGGGGGGGSGGTVVIQGFTSALIAGSVLAMGGGGGQGGDSTSVGEAGSEPTTTTGALGGDQMDNGGNGGNGSATADGGPGTADNSGGGGGGGGGGYIRIHSPAPTTATAAIAPVPTIVTQ